MTSSLYDEWGWDDAPSQADLDEIAAERQQEGPDPFPDDDDEFYYANKLKVKYDNKPSKPAKPGFLQIWEDETHVTPITPTAPNVVKRSDGYKQTAIGSVVNAAKNIAQSPVVTPGTNPYSADYKNPYIPDSLPPIPGLVKASTMVQPQPPPSPQPYVITEVPLVSDYDIGRKIIESTPVPPSGYIPTRAKPGNLGTSLPQPRPRHKVTRQLFLMMSSMDVVYTADLDRLRKNIDKMVQAVIPKGVNEDEICLYNADEMLRQMVIQIVSIREDHERQIIFEGIKRILDMYLPAQIAQKEFIKSNNVTYPHPAYVGIQASLDALNYIYIWTGNMNKSGQGKTSITLSIGRYLEKYKGRLNPLPQDLGTGRNKTVFYYDL